MTFSRLCDTISLMQYRTNQKNGEELSVLGFGCMRFTRKNGAIDQEKAESEMKRAFDLGVNYFDTAYLYSGSEECLGKFLQHYGLRNQVRIATKLPQYLVKKEQDIERYFAEELGRLKTDYVDYYLMHMLNDALSWERLSGLGIQEWIAGKKQSGAIKNIGFSFHGGTKQFKELLDAYDWDFCQVQFNYMDEFAQAGIEGLEYAYQKGIPVIVMEPLRGGRLVNFLPQKALREFESMPVKRSPADWGLRWIWDHKQVNVVLSGMNDIAQVEENARIAGEALAGSLSEEELALYGRVLKAINESERVGCTGCNYCQPCPKGVDIANCFSAYNHSYTDGYATGFREYMMCTTLRKNRSNAGQCVKCGKCEQHCPQNIPIREELGKVRRRLENPIYHVGAFFARRFMKY